MKPAFLLALSHAARVEGELKGFREALAWPIDFDPGLETRMAALYREGARRLMAAAALLEQAEVAEADELKRLFG